MFCPNCGNNCGDAKFCSECGTKLQQKVQIPAQSVQELPKRTNTKKGAPEIPVKSSYIGADRTYLDWNESSITVSPTLGYNYRTVIPFEQLVTVLYVRPVTRGLRDLNGVLLFRGEQSENIPIPDLRHIYTDRIAVFFPKEKDTLFYHVFRALKTVAPATAKFQMIVPPNNIKNLNKTAKDIDMRYFWNMYAPFRELASSGICAKHGLKNEAARFLVDKMFDAQQDILYRADPFDAVRDLNLVVANIDRENRRVNQQKLESKKSRKQEELQKTLDTIALLELWETQDD